MFHVGSVTLKDVQDVIGISDFWCKIFKPSSGYAHNKWDRLQIWMKKQHGDTEAAKIERLLRKMHFARGLRLLEKFNNAIILLNLIPKMKDFVDLSFNSKPIVSQQARKQFQPLIESKMMKIELIEVATCSEIYLGPFIDVLQNKSMHAAQKYISKMLDVLNLGLSFRYFRIARVYGHMHSFLSLVGARHFILDLGLQKEVYTLPNKHNPLTDTCILKLIFIYILNEYCLPNSESREESAIYRDVCETLWIFVCQSRTATSNEKWNEKNVYDHIFELTCDDFLILFHQIKLQVQSTNHYVRHNCEWQKYIDPEIAQKNVPTSTDHIESGHGIASNLLKSKPNINQNTVENIEMAKMNHTLEVIDVFERNKREVFDAIINEVMSISYRDTLVEQKTNSDTVQSIKTEYCLKKFQPIKRRRPYQNEDVSKMKSIMEEPEYCVCVCLYRKEKYSDRYMIECDDCAKWFHPNCIGRSADEIYEKYDPAFNEENENRKFQCPMCIERHKEIASEPPPPKRRRKNIEST